MNLTKKEKEQIEYHAELIAHDLYSRMKYYEYDSFSFGKVFNFLINKMILDYDNITLLIKSRSKEILLKDYNLFIDPNNLLPGEIADK